MLCADTPSAGWRAPAAPGWSMAEFTPRCFLRKPSSAAKRTRSSKATATSPGPRSSLIASPASPERIYEGGRIEGSEFLAARWDLMDPEKYMWASVQTIRGCPKHCSFCSVWRTDGQKPRQRKFQSVVDEIVALRRLGFRFIALADDNFYPVTFTDLRLAREQGNTAKLEELTAIRNERLQLMEELAKLPKDMVFFTQMTMEAGEDGELS